MVSPSDLQKKVSNGASKGSSGSESGNASQPQAGKIDNANLEKGTSLLADSFRKFRKNKMAVFGCLIIACLFMTSIFAKYVAPYGYDEGVLEKQNLPPTWYRSFMSYEYQENLKAWAEGQVSGGGEEFDIFANSSDDLAESESEFGGDTETTPNDNSGSAQAPSMAELLGIDADSDFEFDYGDGGSDSGATMEEEKVVALDPSVSPDEVDSELDQVDQMFEEATGSLTTDEDEFDFGTDSMSAAEQAKVEKALEEAIDSLEDVKEATEAAIDFGEEYASDVAGEALEGDELDLSLIAADGSERPMASGFFERSVEHLEAEGVLQFLGTTKFQHIMGTDEIGQDIMSRLIYGMRLSLMLALTVTLVSLLIGICYGAISGFVGGTVDVLMMRFVDFLFGIPFIFLIILLMVFFGRHVFLIFVGLGLVYWIVLARIVRGQILSLKEKEFIMAARASGVSELKIIFKHLVPNVAGPVIIFSTLLVPQIMLLEAFLSFIGLGVSPPEVSLGIMISDGSSVLSNFSWPIIFPGVFFCMMIFCLNFIGDGLRDALDPKFK